MLSDIERMFIDRFRTKSISEQKEFLASLSKEELQQFYLLPEARLFPKQEVPNGPWRYALYRCGRGFGKSVLGSAWLARKIINGAKSVALYGATFSDVHKIMVPNILRWFPPGAANFNQGSNTIDFSNGAKCYCLTSEKENRGLNLQALWVDEIVIHADGIPEKIAERFDVLDMAVRVGANPQILITSTPKPFQWFIDFQKKVDLGNPRYSCVTGTMWDNPFLSQAQIDAMEEKYSGTRLGRQELMGDLLDVVEGALWKPETIEDTRLPKSALKALQFDKLTRTVIAVDPAVSNGAKSDETGIIVCGRDANDHAYVLADLSGRYSPDEWAKVVHTAAKEWDVDCIVAEKNQGGKLVEANIRTLNKGTRIILVHASKGKMLRAEPVSCLWEQGRCHFVGSEMTILENQLTTYDGNRGGVSPDRLDALVYAITELLINNIPAVKRDISMLPFS